MMKPASTQENAIGFPGSSVLQESGFGIPFQPMRCHIEPAFPELAGSVFEQITECSASFVMGTRSEKSRIRERRGSRLGVDCGDKMELRIRPPIPTEHLLDCQFRIAGPIERDQCTVSFVTRTVARLEDPHRAGSFRGDLVRDASKKELM